MILDLDIGNTRIKWRARAIGGGFSTGVCNTVVELGSEMNARGIVPDRVRVSCVRDASQVDGVNAWLASQQLPVCEIAVSTARAGPLRNGYQSADQLGVDRWLAVCAAWQRLGVALVVVDAGSALTVDFVDGNARHWGGYIVPCLAMQRGCLLSDTDKVRFGDDIKLTATSPGASTTQAVGQGILRMFSSLIERSVLDFSDSLGGEVALLLTGGDGPFIGQALEIPFVFEPDLVLQGIELVMA